MTGVEELANEVRHKRHKVYICRTKQANRNQRAGTHQSIEQRQGMDLKYLIFYEDRQRFFGPMRSYFLQTHIRHSDLRTFVRHSHDAQKERQGKHPLCHNPILVGSVHQVVLFQGVVPEPLHKRPNTCGHVDEGKFVSFESTGVDYRRVVNGVCVGGGRGRGGGESSPHTHSVASPFCFTYLFSSTKVKKLGKEGGEERGGIRVRPREREGTGEEEGFATHSCSRLSPLISLSK